MLWSNIITTSVVLAGVPSALGYPGMGEQMAEIMSRQSDSDFDSTELIGDLLTVPDNKLTPTAADIKKILTGQGNPESTVSWSAPKLGSAACKKDTCCVWQYIVNDMVADFRGKSGRCTLWARKSVRLGFHDAGTWSKTTAAQGLPGGADGSLCSTDEINRPDNNGLQDICQKVNGWYDSWNKKGYPVTRADIIQMAATVATVVCPLGPRVKSYVGRVDVAKAGPPNLLPGVDQSADDLIALFRDKTIGPHSLTALVGAHTTSQQFFVNTTRAGDPQDSTPGVWDVLFYGQTLGTKPTPPRVFKFNSDIALSQHPQTAPEWKKFATAGGQQDWNEDFAAGYIRLSLLGVNNINSLTECTKVLPGRTGGFTPNDQSNLDKWLKTDDQSATAKKISNALHGGESLLGWLFSLVGGILGGLKKSA
ncbi:versatile peroxidase VPL2 [Apiospora marii]|uniref:Peroxidase n=1 Tax=Apiospora marii TaxID=335849 RepID=A0ABR1RJR0_9PEZI